MTRIADDVVLDVTWVHPALTGTTTTAPSDSPALVEQGWHIAGSEPATVSVEVSNDRDG